MTDVSNLDDLANKIANSSPNIKKYAQAQAAATQSQEAEIVKLREDVEMLKRSVSEPPDGGVPPGGGGSGPPPTGTALFDGRASRMNSITGSTKKQGDANWDGNSNASQDPHIWGYKADDIASGVYCITDSCTVIPDSTYTKVFRFNVGPGDTNPYFNQPTKPNAELTFKRPVTPGQWDWYVLVFKIVSPLTTLSWHELAQFGYPSITSGPLSIGFSSTQLRVERDVGACVQQADGWHAAYVLRGNFYSLSSIVDKWVEVVVGVQWQWDTNGTVYVYCRVPGNGETAPVLRYSDTTHPTGQYKTGQAFPTEVNDKHGLYFGASDSPPTNTVLHRGYVRWLTQADAFASLGWPAP